MSMKIGSHGHGSEKAATKSDVGKEENSSKDFLSGRSPLMRRFLEISFLFLNFTIAMVNDMIHPRTV